MRYVLVLVAALVLCTSAAAARVPSFAGCLMGKTVVEPRSIVVACGDGNFYVTNLRWSSWNQLEARASGTGHQNDCKPYCAAGHFHTYRVTVHVFRVASCAGGRREFTRFAYAFVGAKPAGVIRSSVLKSPFYTGKGCA